MKVKLSSQAMYEAYNDDLNMDNSIVLGVKAGLFYQKRTKVFVALNKSNSTSFVTPWGGDPAYTSSIFSRNAYRPSVTAYKLTLKQKLPVKGMGMMLSYAGYGQSNLSTTFKQSGKIYKNVTPTTDASEFNAVISYKPMKNTVLKVMYALKTNEFNGVVATDNTTKAERTINHMRFVGSYKF